MTEHAPAPADIAELESIRRFELHQLMGSVIDDAARRADSHVRLEYALRASASAASPGAHASPVDDRRRASNAPHLHIKEEP